MVSIWLSRKVDKYRSFSPQDHRITPGFSQLLSTRSLDKPDQINPQVKMNFTYHLTALMMLFAVGIEGRILSGTARKGGRCTDGQAGLYICSKSRNEIVCCSILSNDVDEALTLLVAYVQLLQHVGHQRKLRRWSAVHIAAIL